MEGPPRLNRDAVLLDPTGHLLHQAMEPNLGDVAAPPNKEKQPQKGRQNQERKKHVPNERTENSRKMETSNLLDAEFKTVVIRVPNELRERADKQNGDFNKK